MGFVPPGATFSNPNSTIKIISADMTSTGTVNGKAAYQITITIRGTSDAAVGEEIKKQALRSMAMAFYRSYQDVSSVETGYHYFTVAYQFS